MVRIIPWSLPPVKGGSIGGYTPKVDPEPPTPDPEPPAEYFDFDNAVITNVKWGVTKQNVINLDMRRTSGETLAVFTGISNSPGSSSLSGIVPIDIIGVSSLKLILSGSISDRPGSSSNVAISVDPLTYAMTFLSGTYTLNTASGSSDLGTYDFTISSYVFAVYNGNGEIVQQEEVTVE